MIVLQSIIVCRKTEAVHIIASTQVPRHRSAGVTADTILLGIAASLLTIVKLPMADAFKNAPSLGRAHLTVRAIAAGIPQTTEKHASLLTIV